MSFHGQWQVRNPATGEVIADVSCMGQKETNDAISSAYNAYNCKGLFIDSHSHYTIVLL